MTRLNVPVISHLKASKPPAIWKLKIVLQEVIKAVYGETVVLHFERGKVGDNPYENMVHLHASLNPGIQHHIEGILDRKFGPHFIVGYNGQMDGSFTAELDEAERRIDERLEKRN
jgi:hypothetical protein